MADEKNKNLEEEIEENEDVEDQNNEDESGKSGLGSKDDGKSGDKSGRTFTQDQVNKMMTREKNQGRNSVYKELGIDPKDKKTVAMFKAFIDSQKSDEQKAAEKESENQTKVNEAEQRALVAEAKAEAMMLGVKTQFVDDIVTLALSKLTEDGDLKTVIGEFKTKYPAMFGESEEDEKDDKAKKQKTGQKGTGSSVKANSKDKGGNEKSYGARLAAQRKPNSNKKSYWGNK